MSRDWSEGHFEEGGTNPPFLVNGERFNVHLCNGCQEMRTLHIFLSIRGGGTARKCLA
jgi:hypothetical protein